MPNSKEMELEMAGKIDFMYQILSQATIQQEEPKSERKTRKKAKKAE